MALESLSDSAASSSDELVNLLWRVKLGGIFYDDITCIFTDLPGHQEILYPDHFQFDVHTRFQSHPNHFFIISNFSDPLPLIDVKFSIIRETIVRLMFFISLENSIIK